LNGMIEFEEIETSISPGKSRGKQVKSKSINLVKFKEFQINK